MNNTACINFKDTHLLDHIAPLAYILETELFLEDEKNFNLTKEFYPEVKSIYNFPIDISVLSKKYDNFIECKFWINTQIYKTFFNEKLQFIFSPHGNSDKGLISKNLLKAYQTQDAVFIYGNHMIDLLKKLNVFKNLKKFAVIGNYRLSYYLFFKKFYDQKVENEVFKNLDPKKKTIIYAPTWKDLENSTTFFQDYINIVDSLKKNFNLIIKLHPLLEERNPVEFYKIFNTKNIRNIVQLIDYPLVYPLLNKCDIYLGDFSSVGYDFLYFNRPMFFLKKDKNSFLQNCGHVIENFKNLSSFINEKCLEDFSKIRTSTFRYTFGDLLSLDEIKNRILKIC
ncbi:MAG: hypothetical protein A3F40_01200 [Chlamydiae bacterium RIFCSPHIGHO2_12_FULL_27_8]|nr:MAG: hypothetical protein A3F40_01200 [Chlamydiae bacterium RIFCSPHIGHO2_12_FULL_27_8]